MSVQTNTVHSSGNIHTFSSVPGRILRPDLVALAGLVETGEKVLDLGCGEGDLLRHLVDARRVVARGIELTEAGVIACLKKGLSVRQGDLHEGLSDYPDGSFDTVILSYTLPYLNDPAFVLAEMLRVGRRAIVSFPNLGYWRCRLSLLFRGRLPHLPDLPQAWDAAPRLRPLTVLDFIEFAGNNRFEIAKRVYLNGPRQITSGPAWSSLATSAIFVLRSAQAISLDR